MAGLAIRLFKRCGLKDMRPRGGAVFGKALHFLLVLTGVHRLPESVMQPGIERPLTGEVGQNLRFETMTSPMRGDFLVEDEESGIDPGVANDGLLGEALDLPVRIELKGAELRTEGDRGDRGQSSAGVVEVEKRGRSMLPRPSP